jgi:nucleolar protein 53
MSNAVLPPHQPSQPSRKGKKAWRKNVDLTEVESGVEQVREEIIKGYAFFVHGVFEMN